MFFFPPFLKSTQIPSTLATWKQLSIHFLNSAYGADEGGKTEKNVV